MNCVKGDPPERVVLIGAVGVSQSTAAATRVVSRLVINELRRSTAKPRDVCGRRTHSPRAGSGGAAWCGFEQSRRGQGARDHRGYDRGTRQAHPEQARVEVPLAGRHLGGRARIGFVAASRSCRASGGMAFARGGGSQRVASRTTVDGPHLVPAGGAWPEWEGQCEAGLPDSRRAATVPGACPTAKKWRIRTPSQMSKSRSKLAGNWATTLERVNSQTRIDCRQLCRHARR
jgi:hypothetical protein